MRLEKDYVGTQTIEDLSVKYYVIKKDNLFGIEIEENRNNHSLCEYELFTNYHSEALELAQKMQHNIVTLTTMVNILDEYIH